jgi:hypothetical protein
MMSMFGKMRMIRLALAVGLLTGMIGTALPSPGQARQGSIEFTEAGTALAEMLQLAPDLTGVAEEPPLQLATFADLAAQSAAVEMAVPAGVEDENFVIWAYALMPLLLPNPLFSNALSADWPSLLGFDLTEIDQSLEVGEPPLVVTLLRGRFDEERLRAAWANQGGQVIDVDGVEVASMRGDFEIDRESELSRIAFSRYNNAAILPDGTVAFSPSLDGMRATIAAAKGTGPSLGDRVDVAALVGAIEQPLASAVLMNGAGLQGTPLVGSFAGTPIPEMADAVATEMAEFAEMPPITTALLGVTPGGPLSRPMSQDDEPQPDVVRAQFEIALLLPTREAAETAVRVAEERLATGSSMRTGRPLTDYFSSWESRVAEDAPVAVLALQFGPETQPAIWFQMIFSRDLVFLAW